MKNKQEIIDALEFHIREIEHAYLKAQDVLAEALDYVRSSRDDRAEIVAFENDPEIKKLIAESIGESEDKNESKHR